MFDSQSFDTNSHQLDEGQVELCVRLPSIPPLLHALGQGKRDLNKSEKSFQELSTWAGPCPLMNRRPIYLAAFCLLLLLPSLSPSVPPSLLSLI